MCLTRIRPSWVLLSLVLLTAPATASEREELLELRNTILNLVDALVEKDIISEAQAQAMKDEAQAKAKAEAAAEAEAAPEVENAPVPDDPPGKKVVRVPYVPEFIKEDIRNQVKAELRKEVHDDVVSTAKAEKWGTADALPDWVSRFSWFGDIRLRYEGEFFDDENQPNTYANFLAINDFGGIAGPDTFYNFTEEQHRQRLRMRLGFNAELTDEIDVYGRITTGNRLEPVSLNQTQGRAFEQYQLSLDRAWFRYGRRNRDDHEWLVFQFGRLKNPWLHTDLVWDPDIAFEGVSSTLSYAFSFDDGLFAQEFPTTRTYLTLGIMPLEEAEIAFDDDSSNDKWLLGAQLGFEHEFANQSKAEIAAAVYDYVNIVGRFNPNGAFGSTRLDWTAPRFLQKGNTMFPIKFDLAGNPTLFGLASDYTLINMTGRVTLTHFAPVTVALTGDYVKNIGFDQQAIFERTGARVSDRTNAFQLAFEVGRGDLGMFGDWRVFGAYKYLQRDAVLDSLTDSNFHAGGTDGKGWILGGNYGLTTNTSVQLRYMTTDEIDLAPLGHDLLQFDINARF